MELAQVKNILHQTEIGELLMDGMGCSEPLLTFKDEKLIDNFFVYLANKKAHVVSGPIARIGIHADEATVDYLISCDKAPFSIGPKETITIEYPAILAEDYERYGSLYAKIRTIAYKCDCSGVEKQVIVDYIAALRKIVAPAMMKLYEEMAPSFFEWVRSQTA